MWSLASREQCRLNHYNGEDAMICSVTDTKGAGDTRTINITVKAVNDAPYIVAPKYVYVDSVEISQQKVEIQLANLFVGDYDQFDQRDDNEVLEVAIALEVESGTLTIILSSLPAVTAASRQGQDEWKHLDKIIDANNTVRMVGQGIKFHATIPDTNNALQTLNYSIGPLKDTNFRDILQITVDDQGNFGCYGNCSSDISVPLFAVTKVFILSSGQQIKKIDVKKVSLIATVTVMAAVLAVVSGWVWYKWSKKIHIHVEELEELKAVKQKFYDPLWIPEQEETD